MHSSFLRPAASVAAVATAICLSATAQAQTRSFDIPAQSASSGIREFARQAGIQVTLAGRDGEGRMTNAVQGELDTRAALDQLLSGSGLVVRSFDGKIAILGADSGQVSEADAITVTGSRIARQELESAMPVSVIRMDEAFRFGSISAYDALSRDPAIGIGQSPASAANGWDAGISSPNLRNLGTNRSLTLIDGQRRVSSSARSSAVDIGMIPVGMIDRIEVVTGGAAAIYGADAVTGAVNVITKRDIDGLNISATNGISQRGDASEFMVSLATGGKFAEDRGSFSIGGTYTQSDPLSFRQRYDDRGWVNNVPNPANTGISDGIPDEIRIDDMRQFYFAYQPSYWLNGKSWIVDNGTPRVAGYDTLYNPGEFSYGDGGDGRNLRDQDQFRGGFKSLALMGRVDYAITDAIEYGGYFSYARSKYDGMMPQWRDDSRAVFFNGAGGSVAYLDNPYLPAGVRQAMLDNGLSRLNISRTYGNFPAREQDHDRETFTIGQSLGGALTDRLQWEAFWQYGRSEDEVTELTPYRSHWLAARDVISDPVTGQPVCRDQAARAAGCIPLNIFGVDTPSQALLSYVFGERREQRINTQQIYGASVNGALFSLPYGDVSIALGVEHRTEKLKTRDDPLALIGELQYGGGPNAHPELDVSSDVSEVYGEIVVPILSGLPFAERLEVEGAYRYSDYSTVGGTDTWKAAATWAPFDWLTLRGVRSRSVRTPNFGELYEPQVTVQQGSISDPCEAGAYHASATRAANCLALGVTTPLPDIKVGPLTTSGGNSDLKPETSNSLTLGAIVQPAFLPGLDLTVDYWDINITNVITQFSYTTLLNLCVDLPTIDNPYCERIVRDPATGGPSTILSNQLNAARLYARGIDIGANYRLPLGSGRLSLAFKGTWLLKNVTETTPGIPTGDVQAHNNYQNPRFRASLVTAYEVGKVNVALETRFMSASTYDVNAISPESHPDNTVPAMVYNDLSLQYQIGDHRIGFGIRNLFDVKPPNMPVLYADSQTYDIVGRYFFTTVNLKF
jgi:iron complex outermembrane recepter protein